MVGLVMFLLFVAIAIPFAVSAVRKQRQVFGELAAALGGTATTTEIDGKALDVPVRIKLTSRGSGKSRKTWTYVEATLPPGYPLSLHVDRHGLFDGGKIARGEMVDVIVGDRAFDDTFRVEGAPEAVVRTLLDEEVRAVLLARKYSELATEGGVLRLALLGQLRDVPGGVALAETVARMAKRVRDASLDEDRAVPLASSGDAYRAISDDAPMQAARSARAAEVARVEALRAVRARRNRIWFGVFVAVFAVVWIAIMISTP